VTSLAVLTGLFFSTAFIRPRDHSTETRDPADPGPAGGLSAGADLWRRQIAVKRGGDDSAFKP
jgi:hypothetical protein